jgi:hypothetical protein
MTVAEQRAELSISGEFTRTPGPRKRTEGDYSGEQFLDDLLRSRYQAAAALGAKLVVNLDGAAGYPTSFLEEAFGGLAREFGSAEVEKTLQFVCNDEPYLEEQIRKYIREAKIVK